MARTEAAIGAKCGLLARAGWLWLGLFAVGCAPDLRREYPFDGQLPEGSYARFEPLEDGSTRVRVNASHKESWVYLDLDAPREVPLAEALGADVWELAFQRFKVITNGGVSGRGGVEAQGLVGTAYESLEVAPADGYRADAPDSEDGDQDVDSAFLADGAWYAYDLLKHKLVPREVTYVVRTAAGRHFKVRMLSYYDEAGTAAHPSFDFKALAAPR